MTKPYMLISVYERETTTQQVVSLKEAQERMLFELESFGGVEAPAFGMEEIGEFGIHEMNAWSNVRSDMPQDWLIVHLRDGAPYLLISICEHEITTHQMATLKEAQGLMLSEVERLGGVEAPAIGMEEDDEFQIHEMDAWSNVKSDMKQDWLIVKLAE